MDITAPTSKWKFRVKDLFTQYENIPLKEMGIPNNWISLLIENSKSDFNI
jgi:hypothetical protein